MLATDIRTTTNENSIPTPPRVEGFKSPRSGRSVANQVRIFTEDGVYFQSYNAIIAFKPVTRGGPIVLDRNAWNYSRTTSRYRNEFLGERSHETEAKIASGVYVLADLNR